MSELKQVELHPGSWMLPLLRFAGLAKSEQPDVVVMIFKARDERPGQNAELTLFLPTSAPDARVLLEALQGLPERQALSVLN